MAGSGLPQGNMFMQQAGLGNMARLEQVGSTNLPLSVGGIPGGGARAGGAAANLRNTIDKLLGGNIQLNETRAVDLDATYQSAPHAAMGLTVGVSGRATIVNADVASHLAEFQDPIKSLLGVGIHRDTRVIIKRRFVQGGDAQVIPERAPGRTVSVRTEEREVVLARYGCDIEMSTNLMAGEPELAAADLKIKLDFQKRQLDRKLVDLGYEAIMKTATESPRAVLEAMPGRSTMNAAAAAIELENIRARVFFGAFEKYEQPLQNLLAAAKRGSLPNADPYDTMIVPAGLPDLHQFARQEARHYFLNGTPETELDGVKFQLSGGLYDAPSGVTCYVTYPKADYAAGGTLRPRMSQSALYRERTIAMWYTNDNNAQRMDYNTGEWVNVGSNDEIVLLTVMMSSAIVGKGGSDTGELLVAYPMSSVHTVETSPEYFKMQLRTHLGAAVYRPENLQVLPDVHFEGFVSQDVIQSSVGHNEQPIKVFDNAGGNAALGCQSVGPLRGAPANADLPGMAYRGAMRYQNAAGEWTYVSNGGHLGPLDCPEGMSKIRGHNVFSRQPVSVMSKSC